MLEMLSTATLAAAVFAAVGVLESSSSPPQAAAKSVARVMHETMSFTWVLRREMRACVSAAGAGFFRPVRASQSKLMRRGFPRQGPGHARETPGAIGVHAAVTAPGDLVRYDGLQVANAPTRTRPEESRAGESTVSTCDFVRVPVQHIG